MRIKIAILSLLVLMFLSGASAQSTELDLDESRFFGPELGTWYYQVGSIPATTAGTSIPTEVLRDKCGGSFQSVTWYDGSEQSAEVVHSTKGYLFVSRNECNANLENSDYQREPDISLTEGWNIMSVPASAQGFNFQNVKGSCSLRSNVNGEGKELFEIESGNEVSQISEGEEMSPNNAYWVEVDSDCDLNFGSDNYLEPPEDTNDVDEEQNGDSQDTSDRFSISNVNSVPSELTVGESYTLNYRLDDSEADLANADIQSFVYQEGQKPVFSSQNAETDRTCSDSGDISRCYTNDGDENILNFEPDRPGTWKVTIRAHEQTNDGDNSNWGWVELTESFEVGCPEGEEEYTPRYGANECRETSTNEEDTSQTDYDLSAFPSDTPEDTIYGELNVDGETLNWELTEVPSPLDPGEPVNIQVEVSSDEANLGDGGNYRIVLARNRDSEGSFGGDTQFEAIHSHDCVGSSNRCIIPIGSPTEIQTSSSTTSVRISLSMQKRGTGPTNNVQSDRKIWIVE